MEIHFTLSFLFALLIQGSVAVAGSGVDRILPAGIVFPEFILASRSNPAGVPAENGESKGVAAFYSLPQDLNGRLNQIEGAASATFGSLGINTVFDYHRYPEAPSTGYSNLSVGAGVHQSKFSAGVSYEMGITGTTSSGSIIAGLNIGSGKETNFSIVVRDIGTTPLLTLGLGYRQPKAYTMEMDLTLPAIIGAPAGSAKTWVLSPAVSTYAGPFGLSLGTSGNFTTLSGTPSTWSWSNFLAVKVTFFKVLHTHVRLDSVGAWMAGITLIF